MLSLPVQVRIFLARDTVDFRKGFDSLCGIVRDQFRDDPFSGHLFLFLNKRRDRLKILTWDRDGFWIFYKRLERGKFLYLDSAVTDALRAEIDRPALYMLLEGVEVARIQARSSYPVPIRRIERSSSTPDVEHARTSLGR